MKDAFDLKNLDDLDPKTKTQLFRTKRNNRTKLLSIFDLKDELSLDEIIVGLSRIHSVKKSRLWVTGVIYHLKKQGLLASSEINKKLYTKIKT